MWRAVTLVYATFFLASVALAQTIGIGIGLDQVNNKVAGVNAIALAVSGSIAADLTDNGGTGAFSKSFTSGGGTIVLGILGDNGNLSDNIGTTDVKYKSVSCTFDEKLIVFSGSQATSRFQYLYHCLNTASGAGNVDITCAGASCTHYVGACAVEYSGITGVDVNNVSNDAAAVSSLATPLTTVADNSWMFIVAQGFNANAAPGAGTGATRRAFAASSGNLGCFDHGGPTHPAGSTSMTTTYPGVSSIDMSHLAISFKP